MSLGSKPKWWLAKNPMGKVPTIQLEDDTKVLYESLPVCDFLDQAYEGKRKLTPSDPFQQGRDKILIEHYGQALPPHYKLYYRSTTLSEAEKLESAVQMLDKLDFVEAELKKRGTIFFGGKQAMMVDYMIWPWFERIIAMPTFFEESRLTVDRFPKLVWI